MILKYYILFATRIGAVGLSVSVVALRRRTAPKIIISWRIVSCGVDSIDGGVT